MHKHLCWIGRGTHIRGTQHDNKLQHGHTQQDINGTVITCVHTFCLWDAKDSQTQKSGMDIN